MVDNFWEETKEKLRDSEDVLVREHHKSYFGNRVLWNDKNKFQWINSG